jgi:hypothetical protein
MTKPDEGPLAELEAQTERSDPRFARALDSGHPRKPREYRHGPAWIVLSLAVAFLVTGLILPHGLLIATGLVSAGVAGCLFDRREAVRRHPRPK